MLRLARPVGLLAVIASLAVSGAAIARTEAPRQELDYWLRCGMAFGGYRSLLEDNPDPVGQARLERVNGILPQMSVRVDALIAEQSLSDTQVAADLDRLGDEFKAELENLYTEPDFVAAARGVIEPRLDACEARARALPGT